MHYPSKPLSGAELTALLARHLSRHGVHLDAPARGWPAWGYTPSSTVSAERLLLCGDAAGIDALTGEGIAVGMEQGLICAGAIADALASGDFAFRGYRRALRRATVGRELAIDRWLARLLYGGDAWRRWLSLVLCDDRMLDLYAARVCGSLILADHKRELVAALFRHVLRAGNRRQRLALASPSDTIVKVT
jgi:flavin-dependent dehydrogenase